MCVGVQMEHSAHCKRLCVIATSSVASAGDGGGSADALDVRHDVRGFEIDYSYKTPLAASDQCLVVVSL